MRSSSPLRLESPAPGPRQPRQSPLQPARWRRRQRPRQPRRSPLQPARRRQRQPPSASRLRGLGGVDGSDLGIIGNLGFNGGAMARPLQPRQSRLQPVGGVAAPPQPRQSRLQPVRRRLWQRPRWCASNVGQMVGRRTRGSSIGGRWRWLGRGRRPEVRVRGRGDELLFVGRGSSGRGASSTCGGAAGLRSRIDSLSRRTSCSFSVSRWWRASTSA